MKQSTRLRITGGIFLVSLFVIFAPFFFERRAEPIPIEPLPQRDIVDDLTRDVVQNPQDITAVREEIAELIDEDGFLLATGTKIGEPTLVHDPQVADQWAVQLASFPTDASADVLRGQLHAEGFNTWLTHAKIEEKTWSRIAAGPFHSREAAQAYLDEVAAKFKLTPIVVGFQP